MDSPIYFRWEYFSAYNWCRILVYAKYQLNPLDMERVWNEPRFCTIHSGRVRWRNFMEKCDFQALEGSQTCKIALLTQRWSSHGLPNVTGRDGSTSWRVILLCQRVCCVASEPQTMHKFRKGKVRFLMDSQIFIWWQYFSACHWGCTSLYAEPQLHTCSRGKVWTWPMFRMSAPVYVANYEISSTSATSKPLRAIKNAKSICLRKDWAPMGSPMWLVETVPLLGE